MWKICFWLLFVCFLKRLNRYCLSFLLVMNLGMVKLVGVWVLLWLMVSIDYWLLVCLMLNRLLRMLKCLEIMG